ncbi:MAG: LysR family transcriptional regulator [Elusimicrobiota bacterium]
MIPLNYHHLYYFYSVARAGSIAQACKTLLLSQPAISTQLGQLERALGTPLFERKQRKLFLTEEGRFVLDYAESIFEMGQELQDNLKDHSRVEKASIRMGILSGTARAFGHALVENVLNQFPLAYVSVREGELEVLLSELKDQRVDILLTSVSVHGRGQGKFLNRLVGTVPIVFAAAPAVARRYRRIPRDLNGAPFILPLKPSHVYYQILDRLAQWKVEPHTIVEVQDADLARRLAISGRGVAPLNAYTVAYSTPSKALTILGAKKTLGFSESVYLVTRKRKWLNPVVAHLLKNFRLPKMGR